MNKEQREGPLKPKILASLGQPKRVVRYHGPCDSLVLFINDGYTYQFEVPTSERVSLSKRKSSRTQNGNGL